MGNLALVERKYHRHFPFFFSRNLLGLNSVSFTLVCLSFGLDCSSVNTQSNNPQLPGPNAFPFNTICVIQGLKKILSSGDNVACVCIVVD